MEIFQEQVLQRLSRIEKAVEILVDRIAKLELSSGQADGDLWEDLRKTAKEWSELCDNKRKAIHEIMQDRDDRLEDRIKESLEHLESRLNIFEQKVFSVEKGMSSSETATRDVFSLQGKIDNLTNLTMENKTAIGVTEICVKTLKDHLSALEKRFEDRAKNWPSLVISLISALTAIGALGFVILREVFSKYSA